MTSADQGRPGRPIVTIHLPAHPLLITAVLRAAEQYLPGCIVDGPDEHWVIRIIEPRTPDPAEPTEEGA